MRSIYALQIFPGSNVMYNMNGKVLKVSPLSTGPGVELFYEQDFDAPMQIREFQIIPTGGKVPDGWEHDGSAQFIGALGRGIVYHVYSRLKPDQ